MGAGIAAGLTLLMLFFFMFLDTMLEDKEEQEHEKKTIKGNTIFLLIALVLIICVVTNPSQDEFATWYMSSHPDTDEFASLFGHRVISSRVGRDNYIVFSVYRMRMEGPEAEFEAKTLAILGQFLKWNWSFPE